MMKYLSLILISVFGIQLHGQTFIGPTGAIPDDGCPVQIEFPVTVSGIGYMNPYVSLQSVYFDISHSWVGDLEISLESPEGHVIILVADEGGSGDNFINTVLIDGGIDGLVENAIAPFTGAFTPEDSLNQFCGENADGVWKLLVCDDASGDIGTLDSFNLTFGSQNTCRDCLPFSLGESYIDHSGCQDSVKFAIRILQVNDTASLIISSNYGQLFDPLSDTGLFLSNTIPLDSFLVVELTSTLPDSTCRLVLDTFTTKCPPVNDYCIGAIPIVPDVENTGCDSASFNISMVESLTSSSGSFGECNTAGLDQFFTWISTTAGLRFNSQPPGNPSIVIYKNENNSSNPQCGQELSCGASGEYSELIGWNAGDELIIQIILNGSVQSNAEFCLEQFEPAFNNTCEDAFILNISNDTFCVEAQTIQSQNITQTTDDCLERESWLALNQMSLDTVIRISAKPLDSIDLVQMSLYTGNCDSLILLYCDYSELVFEPADSLDYYIAINTIDSAGNHEEGLIDVCATPCDVAENDICALALPLYASTSCQATVGHTFCASDRSSPQAVPGVWYFFEPMVTSLFEISGTSLSTNDSVIISLYEGSCDSLLNINLGQLNVNPIIVGNSYWLYVSTENFLGQQSPGEFELCITPCETVAPSYCAVAQEIPVNPTNSCEQPVRVAITACNFDLTNVASPGCADFERQDIWLFSVVPPSGAIHAETSFGGEKEYDTGMAAYRGNCDSLVKLICDDDDGIGFYSAIQLNNETPGDTIYWRVWEYNGNRFGYFNFCCYDPLGCPPDYADANRLMGTITDTITYTTNGIIESIQSLDTFAQIQYRSPSGIMLDTSFEAVIGVELEIVLEGCENSCYSDYLSGASIQSLLDDGCHPMALYNNGAIDYQNFIGKSFQGGIIFFLDTADQYYFSLGIAAYDDIAGVQYGCLGTILTPAYDTTITSGPLLTYAATGCSDTSAGQTCYDLLRNDYNDWFLPALDELRLVYQILADADGDGINTGLNDSGNIGGFEPTLYHSINDVTSFISRTVNFSNGESEYSLKSDTTILIRPIRFIF